MPCHAARARKLLKKRKGRRFSALSLHHYSQGANA
ncbi:MAG: hypothetical protein ACLR8J_00905 [Sutterella wadsworthensis]